jgi:hypothetical protein
MNLPRKVPNELNELLDQAANEYRINGRIYLYDKVKALRKYVSKLNAQVVYLENELLQNIDIFIEDDDKITKGQIFNLLKRVSEIDEAKKTVIAEGDYEKAARLRDEYNKIPNLIIDLVAELNGFKSGFNYFKGKLVVVTHKDASKGQIIQMLNI